MAIPTTPIGYVNQSHGSSTNTWWMYDGETTPELRWPQSVSVYDAMRTQDAQVGSVLEAVTRPILRTPWRVDPAGARPEIVEFVADDLGLPIVGEDPDPPPRSKDRFSWLEHLELALLMLPFGYSYFEQIYRVDGDGVRAHLGKLEPRPAKTIDRIDVARDGGLISITQCGTLDYGMQRSIPVSRLVAYIYKKEGANWLGRSILRQAYKNWLIKDRLLRVQAQTIERNGMGIPLYVGAEGASPEQHTAGLNMAKAWRAGEAAGTAIPHGAELSLVGVSGTLPDAQPAINYHDNQIARAVLAHFLNLGQESGTGSYALGVTFADFFTASLQTLAQQIADVATQHIVEDLVDVNWGPNEPAPKITFDEIGSRQQATAQSIVALIGAGAITPDERLEQSLRQQYGLPPKENEFLVDQGTDGPPPPPDVEAVQVQASAGFDEDVAALVAALADFTGEIWAADFDESLHPRGPGGRFRDVFGRIQRALADWADGNGPDDPLRAFQDREPLRQAAKKRGVALRRGATRDEIVDALLDDVRDKAKGARGEPKPSAKFTLTKPPHRDADVGVYQEANGKVSLYRESDTGRRGAKVASFDDLAGLQAWADERGEPRLAEWAKGERGAKAPTKTAAPRKAAPKTPSPELAAPRERLRARVSFLPDTQREQGAAALAALDAGDMATFATLTAEVQKNLNERAALRRGEPKWAEEYRYPRDAWRDAVKDVKAAVPAKAAPRKAPAKKAATPAKKATPSATPDLATTNPRDRLAEAGVWIDPDMAEIIKGAEADTPEQLRARAARLRGIAGTEENLAAMRLGNNPAGSLQAQKGEENLATAERYQSAAAVLDSMAGPTSVSVLIHGRDLEELIDESGLRGKTPSQLKKIADANNIDFPRGVSSAAARQRVLIEALMDYEGRRGGGGGPDRAVRRLREASDQLFPAAPPKRTPASTAAPDLDSLRTLDTEARRDAPADITSSIDAGALLDDRDGATLAIFKRQGFDGLPQLVDSDGIDATVRAGGVELYRGGSAEHAEQFRTGLLHISEVSAFGEGIYAVPPSDIDVVERYYATDGGIIRMALRPGAQVVTRDDLHAERLRRRDSWTYDQQLLYSDDGRLGAALGYDAIAPAANPRIRGGGWLVLNRTALAVQRKPGDGAAVRDRQRAAEVAALAGLSREARRDALDERKLPELKAMLKAERLPVSGRKRDLVDRLVTHLDGGAPVPPATSKALTDRDIDARSTRLRDVGPDDAGIDAQLADLSEPQLRQMAAAWEVDLPQSGDRAQLQSRLRDGIVAFLRDEQGPATPAATASVPAAPPRTPADVEQAIRDVVLSLDPQSGGRGARYVPLVDVRKALGDRYSREEVDAALVRLNRTSDANVVPETNRGMLTQADHDAAVLIGGMPKHNIQVRSRLDGTGPTTTTMVGELTPELKARIEADIRGAYQPARPGDWMTITDLRAALGDRYPREQVDQVLREMGRTDSVTIVPESNQKALTVADREAAVMIGNQPKHSIRITGPAVGHLETPTPAKKTVPAAEPSRPTAAGRVDANLDGLDAMSEDQLRRYAVEWEIPNPGTKSKATLIRALRAKGVASPEVEREKNRAATPSPAKVEDKVRDAYRRLKGRTDLPESTATVAGLDGVTPQRAMRQSGWVSLADLRDELADLPREDVDEALRRLALEPGITAIPAEYAWGLTPRERAAELRLGGDDSHWLKIDDVEDSARTRQARLDLTAAKAPDPEQSARDRQVTLDRARHTSEALSEVDEFLTNGGSDRALRARITSRAAVGGDTAVRDRLLTALDTGGRDGLRAQLDTEAATHNLTPIGATGNTTVMDRTSMQGIGGTDIPNGARVQVVRPGYWHTEADGNRVLVTPAVVQADVQPAQRPSGLPTDRRPESGDFDDLADRIRLLRPKTEEAILATISDLNATELARLARKYDGDAMFVPGWNKVSGRRQGMTLPPDMSLEEKRRWLAAKLAEQRFHWR